MSWRNNNVRACQGERKISENFGEKGKYQRISGRKENIRECCEEKLMSENVA